MQFLFAWRYFRSPKSTNAINIIAWISVLAIAVGTAALIVVLSVFNGFEDLVKNLYSDFYSDIRIAPAKGKFFQLNPQQLKDIRLTAGVRNASLVVEEKAVLMNGDNTSGNSTTIIYVKGVDENYTGVNSLSKHIERGSYNLGTANTPRLVLGAGLQNAVGADPGNPQSDLTLYLPNRNAKNYNSLDALNVANVNISGSFRVQQEFDNKYAFTNLPFLQYMLNLQANEYSSVEIAATNPINIPITKDRLQKILGSGFSVLTRDEQNQSLFSAMQVERWVIYGILTLILLVASFNMVGALTMLVLEKQKDIAVLKAMGAGNALIQNIFLSEGFVLAGVGGISGMLLALLICLAQLQFKLVKLQGGTFIIDYYPVKIVPQDFLLVALTVFIVAILAAFVPARKAATQFFSLKS